MDDFTLDGLKGAGFGGFRTIRAISAGDSRLPNVPGVYCVARVDLDPPVFRSIGTGGRHKNRDPNIPIPNLEANWVPTAYVLYIGKADAGNSGSRGIATRVSEYLRFGQGKPVGHWGGRYLWQLADTDSLLVGWRPCEDPAHEEAMLLHRFRTSYGRLPFANLR